MPDNKSEAYIEGWKALYAMDLGVYSDNPYKKGTQGNEDWYNGWMDALVTHW
jgi:hypothetical protein